MPPKKSEPPKTQDAPVVATDDKSDMVVYDDPYSALKTVTVMNNLSLFLMQEGYDFPKPK